MEQYKPFGQSWQDACRRILSAQMARYPSMQIPDLYKLLHQASLGSEHAAPSQAAAWASLERELASLGPGPEDPLLDPVSPGGEIVRVHLRPYLQAGHDPELLLAAFVRTAREYRGSVEHLIRYGEQARRMALVGLLPFQAREIERFMIGMEREGFPAAHHSEAYQALYHPAYRVVCRSFLSHLTAKTES